MKANKTLKRLAKIEALLSGVKARSSDASDLRQALQDARAAVARAKEIVSSQAAAKAEREAKKAAPGRKKDAAKKVAAKGTLAKSAKKNASTKKAVKMKGKTVSAGVHAAAPEAAGTGEAEHGTEAVLLANT